MRRHAWLALFIAAGTSAGAAWAQRIAPGVHNAVVLPDVTLGGAPIRAPQGIGADVLDLFVHPIATLDPMAAAVDDTLGAIQVQLLHSASYGGSVGVGRGFSSDTLVVRTSTETPEEFADMIADLRVMARLVKKTVDPKGEWGARDSIRRLYIEGHGAVLFLSVPFPLAPRSGPESPREADRLWRETTAEIWGTERDEPPRKPHNEEEVATLVALLRDSLSYAGNIRGLPAEESLRLVVTGDTVMRAEGYVLGVPGGWSVTSDFGTFLLGAHSRQTTFGEPARLVVTVLPDTVRALRAGTMDFEKARGRITGRVVASGSGRLTRDLDVLGRVVGKALRRRLADDPRSHDDPYRMLGSNQDDARARYVDGYGVIVQAEVGFPLVGRDASDETTVDSAAPGSLWADTQQEIAGATSRNSVQWHLSNAAARFDSSLVQKLHEALIDILRETANVEALGGDEFVAILVRGPGNPEAALGMRGSTTAGSLGNLFYSTARSSYNTILNQEGGRAATLLTARAGKSDIDRYASGEITREAFRSRVTFVAAIATGEGERSTSTYERYGSTSPDPNAPILPDPPSMR